MDEIHLEFLEEHQCCRAVFVDIPLQHCMDIRGIASELGPSLLVVPLSKKGGQRVCSNYKGIKILSKPVRH